MKDPRQKLPPSRSLVQIGRETLPALQRKTKGFLDQLAKEQTGKEKIPNACVIYGGAAAVLFVLALYYLFTGAWLNGFLVFVLGTLLFGFALHFLQNPD